MTSAVLGVDIGASVVAAAPVDRCDGQLICDPDRVGLPQPGTADQVVAAVGELADRISWAGPIGVAFPGVTDRGVVRTVGGLDPSWLGIDVRALLRSELGGTISVVNDADAVGLAEVRHGAAYGHRGVVVVVAIGDDIGTSLFCDARLVPNTELGHLPVGPQDACELVTVRGRIDRDESWEDWAVGLNRYLHLLEELLWPSLIVIGGAAVGGFDRYAPLLDTRSPVVPARRHPHAVIIGAALNVERERRRADPRHLTASSSSESSSAVLHRSRR